MLSQLGRTGAGRAPAPIQRLQERLYAEADYEKGEDNHAGQALTDNLDETWNSGRMASSAQPVEITIDLGSADTYVDHVELVPYQVPTPAVTHHKVYLDDKLVAEVQGETRHHARLAPVQVGRAGGKLRIQTVQSPSWVAWSQVAVYGSRPQD